MPTALEKMVNILNHERSLGAQDRAVVGGLAAFVATWQTEAREQARRPEQQVLIDEIVDTLTAYDKLDDESDRIVKINHLLDRATNRAPASKAYRQRLEYWRGQMKPQRDSARGREARGRSREQGDRRQSQPRKSGGQRRGYAYDSATYDEDFTRGPQGDRLDIPPMPRLERPPRQPRETLPVDEQLALLEELDAPSIEIKGIGKKFSELLEELGIRSVRDLLYSLPRRHLDYTRLLPIVKLEANDTATVIASITRAEVRSRGRGRDDLVLVVSDGTDRMTVRFFGGRFLARRLQRGKRVLLSGKVTYFRDMKQMANPEYEELDVANLRAIGLVPVYRMTQGLRPRMFRRTMKQLTEEWSGKIPDPLPPALLERAELADLGWALRQAHFPDGFDHLQHAETRLIFDELLTLQLALLGNRREWQSAPATPLPVDENSLEQFIAEVFPFKLTAAQRRALAEIGGDLAGEIPMNRLLQGDVGSGKTAVAIVALARAWLARKQAALMAPTGILAEQHYRSLCECFDRAGLDEKPVIALLTGAQTAAERESIYRGLADGSIDLVVGTHALLQAGLDFQDLALAIIDEQQRFGVEQRAALRGKGANPHLLVMTATPFPRTLALTAYADLDLTLLDEKPPARQEVLTTIIDPVARERLNGFVTSQLEAGRQAFFVHPLVEESDTLETADATSAFERLRQVFFRFRVCLLHGRMSAAEKEEVMTAFAAGDYDVMVTTTVAEVGVDVPNASVMVIDGANRFGLAQLHQFRGRVGRGAQESRCFLIPDNSAAIDIDRIRQAQAEPEILESLSPAERRLAAMESTNDGFALAELDMAIRGAGELLGLRQSGLSLLQSVKAVSPELVELSRREARALHDEDPLLRESPLLAGLVARASANKADVS